MNIHEDILSKLTDEQKKRVEAANSADELLALAKEAGYELTPEQLDEVAGGNDWRCPKADQCPEYCYIMH